MEAIIRKRGGAGVAKVEFDNFSPDGDGAITVFMPIGTKYKFGVAEETAASVEITVQTPVTGYVKFKSGVISNAEVQNLGQAEQPDNADRQGAYS